MGHAHTHEDAVRIGKMGGRPIGAKSKDTLLREEVYAEYKKRVVERAHLLLRAQMTRAIGLSHLFKIEKYHEGKGKNRVVKTRPPKKVTSQYEIEAYLSGLYESEKDYDDDYYYITTKDPDNKALDSLLDRTFGKSSQPIGGTDDGITEVTVIKFANGVTAQVATDVKQIEE